MPRAATLSFDLFVDTESSDPLTLEASRDGGRTWAALPFRLRDRGEVTSTDGEVATSGTRRWQQATAALGPGSVQVRWRYTTDALYAGRGVFVDGVRVVAGSGGLVSTASDTPRRSSPRGGARRRDDAVG